MKTTLLFFLVLAIATARTAQANLATTPIEIFFENFDGATDAFIDKGHEAALNTNWKHSGTTSLRLRDDTDGSYAATGPYNVAAYGDIFVDFYVASKNMDNGESFMLEYKLDDAIDWTTEKEYVMGVDFQHSSSPDSAVWQNERVYIDSTGATTMQVRFRSNSVGNNHRFWIDDVTFAGILDPSSSPSAIPSSIPSTSPSRSPTTSSSPSSQPSVSEPPSTSNQPTNPPRECTSLGTGFCLAASGGDFHFANYCLFDYDSCDVDAATYEQLCEDRCRESEQCVGYELYHRSNNRCGGKEEVSCYLLASVGESPETEEFDFCRDLPLYDSMREDLDVKLGRYGEDGGYGDLVGVVPDIYEGAFSCFQCQ